MYRFTLLGWLLALLVHPFGGAANAQAPTADELLPAPANDPIRERRLLFAADGARDDQFGWSVAVDGDTMVVGMPFDMIGANNRQGAAYVFQRNQNGADQWGQVKKITLSNGAADDTFGWSVAIDGDRIAVGAPNKTVQGRSQQGMVYVFHRNNGGADQWGQINQLAAGNGQAGDTFGSAVALQGDLVAIGAPAADQKHINQGVVYLMPANPGQFSRSPVALLAKDAAANDNFGAALDLDGNTLVVGAPRKDSGGLADMGAAYVFQRNQDGMDAWGTVAYLFTYPYAGQASDQFGWSVAVDNDVVVVGAPFSEVEGVWDQGAAYVFERNRGGVNGWGVVTRLTHASGDASGVDLFGHSVAIAGEMILVGAPWHDSSATHDQGAAYVFLRNKTGMDTWGQTSELIPSNLQRGNQFGTAVAADANTFAIGAPMATASGFAKGGEAYVFERLESSWVPGASHIPNPGAAGFGRALAIDDDTLVVGAPYAYVGEYFHQGAIFIFARNRFAADDWRLIKQINSPVVPSSLPVYFGASVAISGDTIIVGAPFDNYLQGAAYIFSRNNDGADQWGLVKRLLPSTTTGSDNFGGSVAIDGNTVVVGASWTDVGSAQGQGVAHIYERNRDGRDQWGLRKMITPPMYTAIRFGEAVAVKGDTIAVGAPHTGGGVNTKQGRAFVFERNQDGFDQWGMVKTLSVSNAPHLYFGASIALTDQILVVGTEPAQLAPVRGGGYVFYRNQGGANAWGAIKKLTAPDGLEGVGYGRVEIADDTIVVGAPRALDAQNQEHGAMYMFERNHQGADAWGWSNKVTHPLYGVSWDIALDVHVLVGAMPSADNSANAVAVWQPPLSTQP